MKPHGRGKLSMGGNSMEKRKWTDHVRSLYLRYDRMMEKQGFYWELYQAQFA